MAAPANMQAAWDQYWQTFAPGSTVNWSSGTLTRNQDGTATYRDPNGSAQTFSSATPIETVAGMSPYISQQWQSEFGYTPGSNPAGLGYAGSTGSGVAIGPGPAAAPAASRWGADNLGGNPNGIGEWWNRVGGTGTQADLDWWLANTTYTPEQIAAQVPSLGVNDLYREMASSKALYGLNQTPAPVSNKTPINSNPGGLGLINSTGSGTVTAPTNAQPASINTPTATMVSQPTNLTNNYAPYAGNLTAPQANTTMYSAMGAAAAPNVTAGNASAGLINAASATNAPNVTAGTGTAQQATGTTATGAPGVTAGTATGGTATAQGYTSTNANASLQAPAATYTANTFTPDGNSTVKGQIRDIIAENSPLMQQAETRALQKMNTRGLLNSSLAVGAGQSAVFDAALPIAQQDAQTFTQAGLSNQQARNTADQFNAGSTNQVNSQNSQLQTNVNLANAGASNTAAQFGAQAANTASQFNAQTATQVSQFNTENALKAGIVNQEQANAIQKFNAELLTNVDVANMKDANQFNQFLLDQQLKAGIINQDQANKMSQFNAAQALDASKAQAQLYTTVSQFNVDNALKAGVINQEQANKMAQFNAQSANEAAKFNAASANDMAKVNLDSALKAGIINKEQFNTMSRFNAEQANKLAMFDIQNDADIAKFNASESNALKKLGMDSNTKLALADVEAGYKMLMQTSAAAGDLYKQIVTNIANVMVNKDMEEPSKTKAIDGMIAQANAGMGIIGAIANIKLPEIIFDTAGATPTPSPTPEPTPAPAEQTMNTYRAPAPAPTPPAGLINQYYDAGFGV